MRRFLKPEAIKDKDGKEMLLMDVSRKERQQPLDHLGIGTAKCHALMKLQRRHVYAAVHKFFETAMKKLLDTLPVKNSILQSIQCLHLLVRKEPASLTWLKKLIHKIPHSIPSDIDKDRVENDWMMYQCESSINDEWFV